METPPAAATQQPAAPAHAGPESEEEPKGKYLATLALAALGVVYGDIGTSPLYAMRECFHGPHAVAPTPRTCSACCRWCSGRS